MKDFARSLLCYIICYSLLANQTQMEEKKVEEVVVPVEEVAPEVAPVEEAPEEEVA